MTWDGRLRANGHDITDKMPLTMAELKRQHAQQETKMGIYTDEQAIEDSGHVEYDDGVARPAHSDKGASSAERWMNCSGSTALIAALDLPQTDEPSFTREGIAMHEAAADCLARDIDSWEIVGEMYHNIEMTGDMCDAIQMYLDRVRTSIDRAKGFHKEQFFIEAKLAAPDVHEKMFGSVDFGALVTLSPVQRASIKDDIKHGCHIASEAILNILLQHGGFLDVTDLKGGEGIEVDPTDNAQMKYYAFMLIHTHYAHLEDDFPVRLTIVQPRCWSYDGPVRDWWTTVGEIKQWVIRKLLPAMHSTDDALLAGKWCRFCPAKLVCPMLVSLFRAASTADPKEVITLTGEGLGLAYNKVEAAKFYIKALEDEVYRRLMAVKPVPGTKLVNKKAHRIFKETATVKVEGKDVEAPIELVIKEKFGAKAYNPPQLKSPSELEKVPEAKEFVKEYAYMPVTGLTVAVESDKRTGIKVQSSQERFGAAAAALIADQEK